MVKKTLSRYALARRLAVRPLATSLREATCGRAIPSGSLRSGNPTPAARAHPWGMQPNTSSAAHLPRNTWAVFHSRLYTAYYTTFPFYTFYMFYTAIHTHLHVLHVSWPITSPQPPNARPSWVRRDAISLSPAIALYASICHPR